MVDVGLLGGARAAREDASDVAGLHQAAQAGPGSVRGRRQVLEHGLLHIEVVRPEPERSVERIPIRTVG